MILRLYPSFLSIYIKFNKIQKYEKKIKIEKEWRIITKRKIKNYNLVQLFNKNPCTKLMVKISIQIFRVTFFVKRPIAKH